LPERVEGPDGKSGLEYRASKLAIEFEICRVGSRITRISAENLIGTFAAQLEILEIFRIHSVTPGF
jgi:hypothetical protein